MRAIITVVGQDTVGILAAVSQVCLLYTSFLSGHTAGLDLNGIASLPIDADWGE